MVSEFRLNTVDKQFYESQIRNFLPRKIVDIHTHIWLDEFISKSAARNERVVSWPSAMAKENSVENLVSIYSQLFPDKQVTPLVFSNITSLQDDIDNANAYVSKSAEKYKFPALIFSSPQWTATELEKRVVAGNFIGAKVYLSLAPQHIPPNEIKIYDFLPQHQLEVLNQHGWIVMLHIPRSGRLKDPVNLVQMLEIERRYPNIKLIIAHVGRAYSIKDIGTVFEVLADTKNMVFDFSANTNSEVFKRLIKAVGPKRILFGSDLPITIMRTKRVDEDGFYVNLVPRGLYKDVDTDPHIREVDDEQSQKFTLFIYEQINAFRAAAESTGLSSADIEDIFCNNALRIIKLA